MHTGREVVGSMARGGQGEPLALAQALAHPYSLAWVRCIAAWVSQVCRDVPAVHEQAEAAIALPTAQGFPLWTAMGMIFCGWVLPLQGQSAAGMALLRFLCGAILSLCFLLRVSSRKRSQPVRLLPRCNQTHDMAEEMYGAANRTP